MHPVAAYVKRAAPSKPRGYRLATPIEIMRERCPFCAAEPGEPCRSTGSWRIIAAFHAKRMRLASFLPLKGP